MGVCFLIFWVCILKTWSVFRGFKKQGQKQGIQTGHIVSLDAYIATLSTYQNKIFEYEQTRS